MSALPLPALALANLTLPDASATDALGCALAHWIASHDAQVRAHGFTFWLSGDLGAGKTALVRAMLRALNVQGSVKSPTFTLLEPYVVSSLNFYHFDFYRFSEPAEFDSAGFRELFGPGAICAIEWPERVAGRLPTPDLVITLKVEDQGRLAQCQAASEAGARCLQQAVSTMQEPTAGDG